MQLRTIAAREGIRGLYAGYGAFMLRDLPFDAIEFVAYEQGKKAWSTFKGAELNPAETSIVGAFAGGVTGAQPCDSPALGLAVVLAPAVLEGHVCHQCTPHL